MKKYISFKLEKAFTRPRNYPVWEKLFFSLLQLYTTFHIFKRHKNKANTISNKYEFQKIIYRSKKNYFIIYIKK